MKANLNLLEIIEMNQLPSLMKPFLLYKWIVQYLVFPRVLQGTDERPVAAHWVARDGHLLWVGGEVSVDQFRELTETRQTI